MKDKYKELLKWSWFESSFSEVSYKKISDRLSEWFKEKALEQLWVETSFSEFREDALFVSDKIQIDWNDLRWKILLVWTDSFDRLKKLNSKFENKLQMYRELVLDLKLKSAEIMDLILSIKPTRYQEAKILVWKVLLDTNIAWNFANNIIVSTSSDYVEFLPNKLDFINRKIADVSSLKDKKYAQNLINQNELRDYEEILALIVSDLESLESFKEEVLASGDNVLKAEFSAKQKLLLKLKLEIETKIYNLTNYIIKNIDYIGDLEEIISLWPIKLLNFIDQEIHKLSDFSDKADILKIKLELEKLYSDLNQVNWAMTQIWEDLNQTIINPEVLVNYTKTSVKNIA